MNDKKYLTLYRTVKDRITTGEYKAGQKLPSKRTMADKWGCSTVTVESAYRRLIDEGYLEARERSGYFVCRIEGLGVGGARAEGVSLRLLPEDLPEQARQDFEYSVWFRTIRKVIADNGERLFVKSPGKGCAVLRNAIAEYLLRYRGMHAEPERIIIGSGSEQMYETVVRVLGAGRRYGIEQPSYAQIEAVYCGAGAAIERLTMGADGIESGALAGAEIDVLHVTPFHSYPSGVTATAAKRYEYLRWVQKSGQERFIVEDDFDSEFFLPGLPIESLYSLDDTDSVIYLNTFSKSLSPSMRMGYMVLPERLIGEYDRRMSVYSCTVPVLDQYVLAEFIRSGSFERHLNRMRRRMQRTPR